MLVTEPSASAARMLANRVAREMGGGKVGDRVGLVLESKGRTTVNLSEETVIVFTTEGTALHMAGKLLASGGEEGGIDGDLPPVSDFGLIMVDEVHERGVQCDALLGMLKEALKVRPVD